MTNLTIGHEDFHKFREFFYRKTGILFEDNKRYFVDKRLIERMEEEGIVSAPNHVGRRDVLTDQYGQQR